MCKPTYIIYGGARSSYQRDVHLNRQDADTFLAMFLCEDEHAIAKHLNVGYETIRTRIGRLYDKCCIECEKKKSKRLPWQLKKWALDVRLIAILDGKPSLTTYHIAGEGRQPELPFTY